MHLTVDRVSFSETCTVPYVVDVRCVAVGLLLITAVFVMFLLNKMSLLSLSCSRLSSTLLDSSKFANKLIIMMIIIIIIIIVVV